MFESVLVANRGEIARRIIRGIHSVGASAVAVYSEADAGALHVSEADDAILLGPAPAAESYLDGQKVIAAAKRAGAQAIHPGYGFLAENADFAQQVLDADLAWIGPAPESIRLMGDKVSARNVVAAAGMPVAPGTREPLSSLEDAVVQAQAIGYPIMVKAAAGGGGIGMGIAADEPALRAAFETAASRAQRFFGSPAILLERYIPNARHVEIQVLGLCDGHVVAVGERECSVQRRHQKVAEESPSPVVGPKLRAAMLDAAVSAAKAVSYQGAGTMECLVDHAGREFVFLEMNTRLQVEHPVTELVTGLDLVAEQLRVAAADPPGFDPSNPPQPVGHAIEFRVYAEDPVRFLPAPGTITAYEEPSGPGIRVDSGYRLGDIVTPFYDPLLAKLCAHGKDRDEAMSRLREAVGAFTIEGCKTNLPFFEELLSHESFLSGDYDTGLIETMRS
jgi:acetyl-CoA carboxylase, biotin carboxylase subunit